MIRLVPHGDRRDNLADFGFRRQTRDLPATRGLAVQLPEEHWAVGYALPYPWSVAREGEYLSAAIGMYGDQAGHSGHSEADSAQTSLYRDGELGASGDRAGAAARGDGSAGAVPVPPRGEGGPGIDRGPVDPDGGALGFDSAQGDAPLEALPLWALRFRPRVDDRNQADTAGNTVEQEIIRGYALRRP